MNLSEFKSWLEGFTKNLDGRPNDKQWKRIKTKIAEIVDAPATTYPVFVDRWVRPYYVPYWQPYWNYTNGIGGTFPQNAVQAMQNSNLATCGSGQVAMSQNSLEWSSGDAFRELGRAEAMTIT